MRLALLSAGKKIVTDNRAHTYLVSSQRLELYAARVAVLSASLSDTDGAHQVRSYVYPLYTF